MNKTVAKGFRATPAEVVLLETAAKLSKQSLAAFLLRSAVAECHRMLKELPARQSEILERALNEAVIGTLNGESESTPRRKAT